MKVEVWADIICPWCGLGIHRLHRALAQVEGGDEIEVVHRSFQLDPGFPEDEVVSSSRMLEERGMDPDQVRQVSARVENLAAEDGLSPYEVHGKPVGNTSRIHELLAHATEQGKHSEAWQRVFEAYFGEDARFSSSTRCSTWPRRSAWTGPKPRRLSPTAASSARCSRTRRRPSVSVPGACRSS